MNKYNWKEIIKECENSGLPIKQWCEEHQISRGSYFAQRAKLRDTIKENKLIEIPTIQVEPSKHHPDAVFIIGKVQVEIYNSASNLLLQTLMEMIQNAV